MSSPIPITYPDLPVSRERDTIVQAIEKHQVVVVVGDTGSGKTTQLPKMALEFAQQSNHGKRGKIGCTQPRRIAASSVSKRVAEELKVTFGQEVGYQVRFDDRVNKDTRIKFMTDGILLAETQGDPQLKQYHTLIIDEAHERSLNIDFLLGYLKRLLEKRKDLKVIISSATLDAGSFSSFFEDCPVIHVEGRTFPVETHYLPPDYREDLSRHVVRAIEWISDVDTQGDVLVFLPGEREIRDCDDMLSGRKFANTEIVPLFARLGMAEQQRVFQTIPGKRRVVLATNVAETSLTIPGIIYVIDSGVARISRWVPGRQVQRLQIEEISQASARQRKGRCGRVTEGICVRLYDEEDFETRDEFTDPEIRRSSLAGVILRMKSLRLPEIDEFPFIDPPSPRNITEGYRTLREIGALDKDRQLTEIGHDLAKLPIEPRLGRMLLEAEDVRCLTELLVIVSGLNVMDPRERPDDKKTAADDAHKKWNDEESDFISLLHLWADLQSCKSDRRWQRNQLRKFCRQNFVSFKRVLEWDNLYREIAQTGKRFFNWNFEDLKGSANSWASYELIHQCLLAGVPRQFGLHNQETKGYKSANGGGEFAIFPGSGVFGKKKPDWILGYEMVDTSRLWARRVAKIDPEWLEVVAPHLCRSRFHSPSWSRKQGAVYAKETVVCGGLDIISDRRVHYGPIDPKAAKEIFIREGLLNDGMIKKPTFLKQIESLKEEVAGLEQKLRLSGRLWDEDGIFQHLNGKLPDTITTAKAFHKWVSSSKEAAASLAPTLEDVVLDDLDYYGIENFPDHLVLGEASWPLHYHEAYGEVDDGVTIEVDIDNLLQFPEWLLAWGIWGQMEERLTTLIKSLPKVKRIRCNPVADQVSAFMAEWESWDPDGDLLQVLAKFLVNATGEDIRVEDFDPDRLPEHLQMKVWVTDAEGADLAIGKDVTELREQLSNLMTERFDQSAGAEWEMHGLTDWGCGDLPESVSAQGRLGYPALVDEGSGVGLQLMTNSLRAEHSHPLGCARLFLLAQTEQEKFLRKKFPLSVDSKMMLPVLGEGGLSIDDLALIAVQGAMGEPLPRTLIEFDAAKERARGDLYVFAEKVGKMIDKVVVHFAVVERFLETAREDRNLEACVDDIEADLHWLFRKGWARIANFRGLSDYPRYFKALAERVERIDSQPIAKDLEKLDRIEEFALPWRDAIAEDETNLELIQMGYEIQEMRIPLFGTGAAQRGKVSPKKLRNKMEALGIL